MSTNFVAEIYRGTNFVHGTKFVLGLYVESWYKYLPVTGTWSCEGYGSWSCKGVEFGAGMARDSISETGAGLHLYKSPVECARDHRNSTLLLPRSLVVGEMVNFALACACHDYLFIDSNTLYSQDLFAESLESSMDLEGSGDRVMHDPLMNPRQDAGLEGRREASPHPVSAPPPLGRSPSPLMYRRFVSPMDESMSPMKASFPTSPALSFSRMRTSFPASPTSQDLSFSRMKTPLLTSQVPSSSRVQESMTSTSSAASQADGTSSTSEVGAMNRGKSPQLAEVR